ncbi:MAG: SDR family oxidoreductase [Candidatus Aminicenantes bacterium]|nr:SDR family oxidoreductase [Candidatus Aminicenantes bacterium]
MLNEKVAIITGAAGGIGSAAARLLAQHGAVLVLTDIRSKELQELSKTMKKSGVEVLAVEHDIREPESWKSLVEKVKKKYGRVDILINNAGVIQPGAAEEISQDDVHHQVSVNFLGTINGCRAVLPTMKEQGSGKIVNVASLGGIVPMPGEAVYSATKSAIRGYSLSLHAELRNSPVGIAVVCPDSVDTPQLDYELQYNEAVLSFIGDPMKPEKVAKGILKAVRRKKPEVLVPSGMGVFCRIGMAFPKLYFSLLPLLEKIGSSTIRKRREKKKVSK